MNDLFEVATASVPGREHVTAGNLLVGKNNQDGYSCQVADDALVMIVCDGCSSSPNSDVGAKLGAQLFAEFILRAVHESNPGDGPAMHLLLEQVRERVLAIVRALAIEMGHSFVRSVNDFFLFTVMGTIVTKNIASIFSIGDGVFALNGEIVRIGPFPGNAPPYAAYALVETTCPAELLRFTVHHTVETSTLQSVLIGSDGVDDLRKIENKSLPGKMMPVGPLSQFWIDDQYYKNPDSLRRRLVLANSDVVRIEGGNLTRFPGLLPDDTTLCVLRRRKEMKPCTS